MGPTIWEIGLRALFVLGVLASSVELAEAQPVPRGIADHGIAAPVGMSAWGGTWATVDNDGRRLVFIKLWAAGNSSYLFIDVQTGKTEQIYPGIGGEGAYVVQLSHENKIYDTMGEWLLEIDIPSRQIHRIGKIPPGMALSFVISPDGVLYGGIYPSATLVSYNLNTRDYRDHGPLNKEDWPQYLRPLALDDQGWIYGGIAIKAAQIVGYNLATGEKRTYIPDALRKIGGGNVFRGVDGKVYAQAPGWGWHVLCGGECAKVEKPPAPAPTRDPYIFPDKSRLVKADVPNRALYIQEPHAAEPHVVKFEYQTPGVPIFSMVAGPDGKIYGATGAPLRIWRFDPTSGRMENWGLGNHGGHVNQWVHQHHKLYGAVYSSGSLIELDPTQPIHDAPIKESKNPRHVHGYEYGFGGQPDIFGRPHALLAHPDGRHVIMGGNPARALVGGGLLIYDVKTGESKVMKPAELVPDQGVYALAALPNGDLIIGTTTEAATGGRATATAALLYRLDWHTKRVTGRWSLKPRTVAVRDIIVASDGLVYGLAAGNRFFVFDPEAGRFVHDELVEAYGPLTGSQAPRTMALGPDGGIYVLFRDAIARIEPRTFSHREIVRPGVKITAGIVIQDHYLYFAAGSRLFSYDLRLVH